MDAFLTGQSHIPGKRSLFYSRYSPSKYSVIGHLKHAGTFALRQEAL